MAGNPAAALEEAIGAAMDGWKPESGKELSEFLSAFPDVLRKLAEAFNGIMETADETGSLEENFGDSMEMVGTGLYNSADAATQLTEEFTRHYAFFLGG